MTYFVVPILVSGTHLEADNYLKNNDKISRWIPRINRGMDLTCDYMNESGVLYLATSRKDPELIKAILDLSSEPKTAEFYEDVLFGPLRIAIDTEDAACLEVMLSYVSDDYLALRIAPGTIKSAVVTPDHQDELVPTELSKSGEDGV